MRDAVFSGMTLDIFNRNPEKAAMVNCAQLINCLNSLYLAHGDKFCVTPVGHVFAMYAAHQGGQAVRTIFSAPTISYDRDGKPATFWGLQGSASLHDKDLILTAVNPAVHDPCDAEIVIRDARIKGTVATTLTHSNIHAHNTFERKEEVSPQTRPVPISAGALTLTLPQASVTSLMLTLA